MITKKLTQLRRKMAEQNIDIYLIVSGDFHGSEYVGDYFKCREFISGFTGSAGSVVITKTEVGLFTDGRYFLQAEEQLQGTGIKLFKQGEAGVPTLKTYINEQLKARQCLGFDGKTVSTEFVKQLQDAFDEKQILINGDVDLIGEIWLQRTAISKEPVWELGIKYAGESRTDKIAKVRRQMSQKGATQHIISDLMDIAWLLNLRGADVQYCPVFLAYAVIEQEQMIIFAHRKCFSSELIKRLKMDGIVLRDYEEIYDYVKDLGRIEQGALAAKILLDESKVNYALTKALGKDIVIIDGTNPTTALKAVKNEVEIANIRNAHIQDGVAITKLWYWLLVQLGKEKTNRQSEIFEKNISKRNSTDIGHVTELSIASQLEEFRHQSEHYLGASFASIVGYKEHGAIIHYIATKESDATIKSEGLLLMDVGGHYLDGSTDITRTITLGKTTKQQKKHYTAVLQGNINLAKAKFSQGTTGNTLDGLARQSVQKIGLDYKHGTGHGIGYLLSVHEGPQVISEHGKGASEVAFAAGMITSDEPGIYLQNEYGIRLENLILCKRLKGYNNNQIRDGEVPLLGFEVLTMVPFDVSLINVDELAGEEKQYLNQYHEEVRQTLLPFLTKEEGEWLVKLTAEV